ncbi:unnamed protein product [Knipowitschia caucasica]|uniref:Myb/SANT-like DNA-binding domain-containing protein n=1 Tax=Knipowitschia caucasica TaxID=637954 RepID=A0AAV2J3T9_KNICA
MNSADYTPDEDFRVDPALVGMRSKPRFSHTEVKVLLLAIKKHRYILLRKFNQGVSADAKKMIWCRITDQINSLGENQREVRQIMKKWADLKFDAKRRMTGPNRKNFRRKHLGPIERAVHKILTLSPNPDGDSDADLDQDRCFASISLPDDFSLSSTSVNSYSEAFSSDRTADDMSCESPEYGLDFEEEEDDDQGFLTEPDDFLRSKPTYTYSRQESSSSQPAPAPQRSPEPPQRPEPEPGQSQPPQDLSPVAVCVQQQRQARTLLASVGRSVETLARSLQQLKERQQLFTQESLQLQRQTVDTLRDFSSTALAMLRTTPRPKHHTYTRK